MKLKSDFIVREVNGETVLVPIGDTGFSGMVRGNKTLGAILQALKADVTEDEIVSSLLERFDAPEEKMRADVQKALSALRKIGALRD